MVRKLCCLTACLTRLASVADAIEGAPTTLGYPSPEATAPGHPNRPSCPLGRHKDDVHAVGVMGLLFLSPEGKMPFGPSKGQWEQVLRDPTAFQEVKKSVVSSHKAWVSHAHAAFAHPMLRLRCLFALLAIMLVCIMTTSCDASGLQHTVSIMMRLCCHVDCMEWPTGMANGRVC